MEALDETLGPADPEIEAGKELGCPISWQPLPPNIPKNVAGLRSARLDQPLGMSCTKISGWSFTTWQ